MYSVVPEGSESLLIPGLSKRGFEHVKELLRPGRARVGCVCQHRAQHKCEVRKLSRVAEAEEEEEESLMG